MVSERTLFKYKTVKGFLHKLPVIIKFLLLIFISFFCFTFSAAWLLISVLLAFLSAFLLKFTAIEQLTDLKPALFFAAFMYLLSLISGITDSFPVIIFQKSILIPNPDFVNTALRLVLIIQLSALFFRTTSFIEIKECLNTIEYFLKRVFKNSSGFFYTDTISLFLMFIPEFFNVWSAFNLAWKARGGKPGVKKIKTLVFLLITASFEKAAVKAKAIESRGRQYEK
ncbi:MAG: hypothetical protein FWC17_04135 [Treponema sp.]|nr:hypothetical protein [Treponema sp.]